MKVRAARWLGLAALVVVGGALWISAQRQLPRATLVGAPVLPGLLAGVNDVNQIRIARGDGTTATLERLQSGEWQVRERGYRADVAKLRKLLLDSGALAIVEEKTRDPANYAALGVDEPKGPESTGTLLEIRGAKQTQRLIVGRSSGARASFVRVPDQEGSVLATPQLVLDPQPSTWLDQELFDLPSERVKTITRRPPTRAAAKNAPVESSDLNLADFTFDDLRSVTTQPAGAAAPQLSIETKDGMVVELTGVRDAGRSYVAVTARALEGAEPKVHREASDLAARTAGRQFELPGYRYDSLFPAPPASAAPAKRPAR